MKRKKLPCRILSDLHAECIPPEYHERHFQYALPKFRNDKDSVLILAGDIWKFARVESYVNFLEYIGTRFRAVVYVHGNHEFYHSCYNGGDANFKKYIEQIPNFHYLNGQSVVIDDVVFIGATLWTDYRKNDPLVMLEASSFMYDYVFIRLDSERLITTDDIYNIHQKERMALEHCLRDNIGRRCVVVTHHGCSYKSIHPKYVLKGGLTNYAFTSDLDELILTYQPDLWIHGHTHESFDYKINKTNVIVNPVGYDLRYTYENANYNPKLRITV